MIRDPEVREALSFYAMWAILIGLLTTIIRPFISIKQLLKDVTITFLVSFFCGLALEYFDISVPVKCGISGTMGLFAIFIYNIIARFLSQIGENPIHYLNWFKDKNDKS